MDRSDVLAALVAAQRDLALHLDTARTELISLPHQLADLQPMKTVMGSYMGQRIPHARILAEELWAGESHYGSSTTDRDSRGKGGRGIGRGGRGGRGSRGGGRGGGTIVAPSELTISSRGRGRRRRRRSSLRRQYREAR